MLHYSFVTLRFVFLPKDRWTHQAHLAAGFWYLNKFSPDEALSIIRERIQRHNESVGTANTDNSGYHETLTCLYMSAITAHISLHRNVPFDESLDFLLKSPLLDKVWPPKYYSKEHLFSVLARREWVEPDLQPIEVEAAHNKPLKNDAVNGAF